MKKICANCHIEKDKSSFTPNSKNKDGLNSWCRDCYKTKSLSYSKTKNGVISKIYNHQKEKSKRRNHPLPSYTFEELKKWCFNQEIFNKLYDEWVISNYDTNLKPSIDRLDDYKPYSFDNIQITTWQQNNKKANEDRKNGNNNKGSKAVVQFDLNNNEINRFHSSKEAERITNIPHTHILNCCMNKPKYNTAGGFIWRYADDIQSSFLELELNKVYPNPNQPRKDFKDIDELANSIKENGLIQPIAVVKTDDGYMIISGERRYRACKELGLKTIKTHLINADDKKVLELALVENIQRDDLTDFEKAKFINQLWASGHYAKKQDLAKAIGKSQSYISKVFKAVKLCDEIIKDIEEHKKDIGLEVLQELSNVKDKDKQLELYLDGATRDNIRDYNQSKKDVKISRAKIEKKETQLYAMIKKSSRHYSQQSYHTENGKPIPFEVTIPTTNDVGGVVKGGIGGNYDLEELNIYVKVNGEFLKIKG